MFVESMKITRKRHQQQMLFVRVTNTAEQDLLIMCSVFTNKLLLHRADGRLFFTTCPDNYAA